MSVDPSQYGLLSQGLSPDSMSVFDQSPGPQIQPQAPQQPMAQPQQDPMQAIMADITRVLKAPAPAFTEPSSAGFDAEISQEKAVAKGAETQLEGALAAKEGLGSQIMQGQQAYDQQIDQLFQKYPSEQVAYGAAMHAAPQLAILAALGGKAAGLSGQMMLGSLTGMMEGLNKGASDQFQQSLDKWKQQLQQYKERHQEQMQMYQLMLDSYQGRADAAQKARDFALQMTHDAIDQKEYAHKDAIDLFKARTQAFTNIEKAQLMFDKIAMQMTGGGAMTPEVKQVDAALTQAGVQLPGAGRGGQLYWQKLNDLVAANPGKSPQEIAQMAKEGTLDMTAAKTETTTAARKEASIGAAQEALNSPGGLWDQVDAAAKKVDFGDAKFKNNMELAAQGKVIANKDIQSYVSSVMEARAELSQVFSRSGQTTDMARKMAEEAIPLADSYEELQAAKAASQQGAQAVRTGNQRYMDQAAGRTGSHTEGEKSTSKSGKPIVWRNGQWEYS